MPDAVGVDRRLSGWGVVEPSPEVLGEAVALSLSNRAWRWWSHRLPLAVIVVATGLLYTILALAESAHLLSYAFDLGVYYEALRGYAHFGLPLVALKGVHYDLLGDHFEPMVAVLAPTYWIWPHPDVLLVDQAVLVALSVIPVWMFTERRFGTEPEVARLTTTCLVAAYALAWEIQSLVGFDFHSLAFAVPILAVAIERADAGRWKAATIWVLLLLLVKEDLALVVAAFRVYAFLRGRRRLGVFLATVGVTAFGLFVGLVVPAFAGGIYPHWSYGELGPGPLPALRYVVMHPIATLQVMVSPKTKLGLLAWVFLPGALLSLVSPIVILAVPLLLERVLSERPNVWSVGLQYSAPLAPIIGMAAIDGLWRCVRWRRHDEGDEVVWPTPSHRGTRADRRQAVVIRKGDRAALAAFAMAIVALIISLDFPLSRLVANHFQIFGPNPSVTAVERAELMLPRGVTVAASDNLVALLLNRDNPLVMSPDSVCGSWVLAWTGIPQYPYRTQAQMLYQLSRMEANGWAVLFERAGLNSCTARGRATGDIHAYEMTLCWRRSSGTRRGFLTYSLRPAASRNIT